MIIDYLRLLWRICGRPVMQCDERFREMLRRAGWRPFEIERLR